MTDSTPSKAQANLQLAIWSRQAESTSSEELYVRIQKLGLPEDVVSMLHSLILKVQQIAGKVIQIGKIILIKLLEFIEDHLFLSIGTGIGALLGAALASLITAVPFIGPFLTPIAQALGLTITAVGAIAGHNLDKILPSVGKSLVDVAKEFFKFFQGILRTILQDQSSNPSIA